MKSFGELVVEKRLSLGLSREELASRLGVPEDVVEAIETGRFFPPSFFLPAILRVLGDEDGSLRAAYQNEAVRCFGFG